MKTRVQNKYSLTVVVLIFLVAASFLAVSIAILLNGINLKKNGVPAAGTVIELKRQRSGRSVSYKPVIEFTAEGGVKHTSLLNVASNPPRFSKGEKVTIIYSKDNPDNIIIDSVSDIYIIPIIFDAAGVLFIFTGVALIRKRQQVKACQKV